MDPKFRSYYQYHVRDHKEMAQEQALLPQDQKDPTWIMMMELDPEASIIWALTHPMGRTY